MVEQWLMEAVFEDWDEIKPLTRRELSKYPESEDPHVPRQKKSFNSAKKNIKIMPVSYWRKESHVKRLKPKGNLGKKVDEFYNLANNKHNYNETAHYLGISKDVFYNYKKELPIEIIASEEYAALKEEVEYALYKCRTMKQIRVASGKPGVSGSHIGVKS